MEDIEDSIEIDFVSLKSMKQLLIDDNKIMDKAGILLTPSLMDSFKCYPIKHDTVPSEYSDYESVMKRLETREKLQPLDIINSNDEIDEYVSENAGFNGLTLMSSLTKVNRMSTEFLLWLKNYVDRLCQSRVPSSKVDDGNEIWSLVSKDVYEIIVKAHDRCRESILKARGKTLVSIVPEEVLSETNDSEESGEGGSQVPEITSQSQRKIICL